VVWALFHTIQMLAVFSGIEADRLSIPEPPLFLVQMLVPHSDVELSAANAKALKAPVDPIALTRTPVAAKQFTPSAITAIDKTTKNRVIGFVISFPRGANMRGYGEAPVFSSAVRSWAAARQGSIRGRNKFCIDSLSTDAKPFMRETAETSRGKYR
jgi:hypothetical protein